jgi:hypothetical protein
MTPAERNYRRVLRLLPAGYRQLWEEDMVSAYLEGVGDSRRRSVGEWFAVAWLALRLRLNGSHASPRARLWYQTVLGIALLTTLYEGVSATVVSADIAGWTSKVDMATISWQNQVTGWYEASGLLWAATFLCLVLGRLVAARVLALVALAYEFGPLARLVNFAIRPSWWSNRVLPYETSHMHQAWIVLTAVAVFLVPKDFRPSRGWLAAYLVPAAVMVPIAVAAAPDAANYTPPQWLQGLQLVNVGSLLHVGLIVGMIVILARARRWLFPLAIFSGAVAAVQLVGYTYGLDYVYTTRENSGGVWTGVNLVQLALAIVCAVAGFIAVRRDARSTGKAQPDDQ